MPRASSLRPRLGSHTSSAGGPAQAAERAHAIGGECLQIFTSSPRQWKPTPVKPDQAEELQRLRRRYHLRPLVVHANYLINLAGQNADFHARSLVAFRGELERAAVIGADYLVLHPGSGPLERCCESLRAAAEGFVWGGLTLLIENTAGGGNHLGGRFEQLGALLAALPGLPVGVCLDTCHAWAAGYDLVSARGYRQTWAALDQHVGLKRVPVLHLNDSKGGRGSHLDRHQNIGQGQLGDRVFRRLLRDPALTGKALILETPLGPDGTHAADLAHLRRLARAHAAATI